MSWSKEETVRLWANGRISRRIARSMCNKNIHKGWNLREMEAMRNRAIRVKNRANGWGES